MALLTTKDGYLLPNNLNVKLIYNEKNSKYWHSTTTFNK